MNNQAIAGLLGGGNATPTTPTDASTSSTPSLSNVISAFTQPTTSQPLDVAGPTSTQPSSDITPASPVSFTQPSLTLPQTSTVDFAQPTPSTTSTALPSNFLNPDLTSLTGGSTGAESAPAFNPASVEPGGLFSPTATTGQIPSTADVAQALDPSRQVPTAQEQQQQPEPAQQQQQVPQPQPQQPQPQPGLPQLARSAAGGPSDQGAQPQVPQAAQPAAAPQPQAEAPAAVAPPQPAQRQPSGGGGAARPPPAPTGGVPPLLQAIMALLGVQPMQRSLSATAQQAYPQRPFMPQAPTAQLGPYARARANRQPGKYQQPSQQEWERNMRGLGPAPGQSGAVTAPTQQQAQQSKMRGNFTQATPGFSSVLAQERAKFANELNDPRVRWETLAMIAMEMEEDPAAVAESLLNRSDYAKTSIHNMLHSGFYGPINFGKLAGEIRRLQANPERAAKINAGLETALRGSNLIGGATDQGMASDPNAKHGPANIRYGEIYNDWGGGPGGHTGAEIYRQRQQQRVRAGMHQAEMGEQFAMDITRRIPMTGGAEMEVGGGMMRRGAPATEFESATEQRRKRERERERARAGILS